MPQTWENALSKYRYPDRGDGRFDLARFADAQKYRSRGWFEWSTDEGNLANTQAFELRFRELGPHNLEAWAEVVFWKLYTMGISRDKTTRQVLTSRIGADKLWQHCANYIEKPSLQSFRDFREKLFQQSVVATAATFPAFICPEKFPMVDKQVTEWARIEGAKHSYRAIAGPSISCVPELDKGEVLRESHWAFVESWIEWCQFTASRLHDLTGSYWRARDVEMAVFTAQRSRDGLTLNPLV